MKKTRVERMPEPDPELSLAEFLSRCGLSQFFDAFEKDGVTLEILKKLSTKEGLFVAEMTAHGLGMGHRDALDDGLKSLASKRNADQVGASPGGESAALNPKRAHPTRLQTEITTLPLPISDEMSDDNLGETRHKKGKTGEHQAKAKGQKVNLDTKLKALQHSIEHGSSGDDWGKLIRDDSIVVHRSGEPPFHLVLVLGGVSHNNDPAKSLNRIYARLEERPSESPVDVVVVDPDSWQSIPIGRVQHVQMDLEAYVTEDRISQLLGEYETIAVIDDLFFKIHTEREAIIEGRAWRALASAADERPDVFTWWVIKGSMSPFELSCLVRMNNYTIRMRDGTQRPLPLVPVSHMGTFYTIWNPLWSSKVDFVIVEHPFRELILKMVVSSTVPVI